MSRNCDNSEGYAEREIDFLHEECSLKKKKGRDYKCTRQWTNEEREAKKRLRQNLETAFAKGELDEDKLVSRPFDKKSEGEK